MDKHDMVKSASILKPPSVLAAKALGGVVDICAAELTSSLTRRKDLDSLIGPGNVNLVETNHINHFRYIASLAALYDPLSFVEIVIWVFRTYRAHGFAVDYWEIMLPEAKTALRKHLDPSVAVEIEPFHDWLLAHIADFKILSDEGESLFESMSSLGGHHAPGK